MDTERLLAKYQMLKKRKGADGGSLCDLCRKNHPSNMHELVPRSHTLGSDRARILSYTAEVCSLLCSECHGRIHDIAPHEQDKLWLRQYELYGKQEVLARVDEIKRAMKSKLYVRLPE